MSNNINWLEQDTVVDSITSLIEAKEHFLNYCDIEMSQNKSKFETKDINEATAHDYWRGIRSSTEITIRDLKELLTEIADVKLEELEAMQEAEEQDRDNRHSSYIGG